MTNKRIRLSDLIRGGAERTIPLEGSLISPNVTPLSSAEFACAWGCVVIECSNVLFAEEKPETLHEEMSAVRRELHSVKRVKIEPEHHPPSLSDEAGEMGEYPLWISEIITRLNDHYHWSRTAIADYIDTLIDEHHYSLAVSIERKEPTPA